MYILYGVYSLEVLTPFSCPGLNAYISQRMFWLVSNFTILNLSGLCNPDRGYFGKIRRARENGQGWEK